MVHLTKLDSITVFTSFRERGRLASIQAASDLSPSVDWLSNIFSLMKGSLLWVFFSSLPRSSQSLWERTFVSLKA